jgi:hypothetical protein
MSANLQQLFPRGAVVLSVDTEHIWGYFDELTESQFREQFPGAIEAQERLLTRFAIAGLSATWFVVGAFALRGCTGTQDPRLAGLPERWTRRIPEGHETSQGLWYRPSFLRRLRDTCPLQEIGLHGGLTHLVWTGAEVTRETAKRELAAGLRAMEDAGIRPRSFSFARSQQAHLGLLAEHGLKSFRGPIPALSWRLGRTWPGALLRLLDEWRVAAPPVGWPHEILPGLWNVPASLFLYPIAPRRARLARMHSRVERFYRGIEAAVRYQAVFHFSLHPENLTESRHGFTLLDDILDRLLCACRSEGIEVLTMSNVVTRMERNQSCSTGTVIPATI